MVCGLGCGRQARPLQRSSAQPQWSGSALQDSVLKTRDATLPSIQVPHIPLQSPWAIVPLQSTRPRRLGMHARWRMVCMRMSTYASPSTYVCTPDDIRLLPARGCAGGAGERRWGDGGDVPARPHSLVRRIHQHVGARTRDTNGDRQHRLGLKAPHACRIALEES